MKQHSLTDAGMAEVIGDGCSRYAVAKLRTGRGRPSLDRAIAIDRATNGKVSLRDWAYPPAYRDYERKRWRERTAVE